MDKKEPLECKLFSQEDVCKRYDITSQTLLYWHRKKTAPQRLKIGQKVFYRLEDLVAFEATKIMEEKS